MKITRLRSHYEKAMRKRTLVGILISFCLLSATACTRQQLPDLIIAEEKMVQDCYLLDTIAEISDPGIIFKTPKFISGQKMMYDGQRKVLLRADKLGATHIVWLYNYTSGSAALAYYCDEEKDFTKKD